MLVQLLKLDGVTSKMRPPQPPLGVRIPRIRTTHVQHSPQRNVWLGARYLTLVHDLDDAALDLKFLRNHRKNLTQGTIWDSPLRIRRCPASHSVHGSLASDNTSASARRTRAARRRSSWSMRPNGSVTLFTVTSS